MTEHCAVCGLYHNAGMSCARAQKLRDTPTVGEYQRRVRALAEQRRLQRADKPH